MVPYRSRPFSSSRTAGLDEFAAGIVAGEEARASGSTDLPGEIPDRGMWFALGYFAGRDPDRPPSVPAPLALNLTIDVLYAAADAWLRDLPWTVRLPLSAPVVIAEQQLTMAAARRRALRLGLRRATDAPPGRLPPGHIPMMTAITWARRWDAKRRGVGPPSLATLAGVRWTLSLERERRWRSNLRAWRARTSTGDPAGAPPR